MADQDPTTIEKGVNEVWKPVVGYEGLYEISSFGRIRGYRINRCILPMPSMLKPRIATNGYYTIALRNNGLRRTNMIHRLVLAAFAGPIPNGFQVNHKNGIKTDNCFINLEYVTPHRNRMHALFELGCLKNVPRGTKHWSNISPDKIARGSAYKRTKLTEHDVLTIRKCKGVFSEYKLSRMYGVGRSTIRDIFRWKTWKWLV